ncbi:MAG: DUF4286 family protein [Cytophagales bacterium]|uniref:DUF4286 family protein n=1 Tax=Algoriphagus taiwanensis TaxID=1445656 RepID=A0ABQ6Q4M7_9BACT|nr:MAG: DUF4286 family protein [Cytophagales bacterium]GMQ35134.1 DUF4286 family protein [Algoriphagus taiwanensis]
MILYNITINVTPDIEEDFLSWMKSTHIPEVLETGIFHEHKFFRLLHDSEDGSTNYCIQYFTDSMEQMMEYEKKHASILRAKTQERYRDKAVAFRTLLETI